MQHSLLHVIQRKHDLFLWANKQTHTKSERLNLFILCVQPLFLPYLEKKIVTEYFMSAPVIRYKYSMTATTFNQMFSIFTKQLFNNLFFLIVSFSNTI